MSTTLVRLQQVAEAITSFLLLSVNGCMKRQDVGLAVKQREMKSTVRAVIASL